MTEQITLGKILSACMASLFIIFPLTVLLKIKLEDSWFKRKYDRKY